MLSRRVGMLSLLALAACTTQTARRPVDTAAPATATLAGTPSTADTAAVRRMIEAINARSDSANIRGDSAAMMEPIAADAVILSMGKPLHGYKEIAKASGELATEIKTKKEVTSIATHTEDVILVGDAAVETGTTEVVRKGKAGRPVHIAGRYLAVWRKQPEGSYKLVRVMFN